MGHIESYQDLAVWKKGMTIAKYVYEVAEGFPKSELYGLVSQMRRASVSLPSNVAEGYRRQAKPELRRYLLIALGSAAELETQLLLSHDLGFVSEEDKLVGMDLLDHFSRMSTKFIKTIE